MMATRILYFVTTVVASTVALGRELPLDDPPTWAKLLAFTDLPQAATITWAPAPAPTPQIDTVVFQFEGAYLEDGKGWSIWDDYTNNHTFYTDRHIQNCGTDGHFVRCYETVHNNETGNVSCDFYHRYKEDLALAKRIHAQSFRFSVAWTRIFPDGDGAVNPAGVQHYVDVVDELLALGIEPAVTLYHWDLPMALQERFGGFNSEAIIPLFTKYAVAMFQALGDKVNYWTTFNEPASFCFMGYGGGYGGLAVFAPGIHDAGQAANCTINVLKAHAAAVQEFRKIVPGGKISMNLNSDWAIPFHNNSELDKGAAQRRLDYTLGLFADPVYLGQFPESVRARIPHFPNITPELASALYGSCDYFALNHYTTVYAKYDPNGMETIGPCEYAITHEKDGVLLGVPADADWIYSVPWGFRELLKYINNRYKPKEISVTENGFQVKGESNSTDDDIFIADDQPRIQYFKEYILEATKAVIYDGVPMTSYHAWALTDNYEWNDGYSKHFGVVHVDFATQKRTPRASARFLANLFKD